MSTGYYIVLKGKMWMFSIMGGKGNIVPSQVEERDSISLFRTNSDRKETLSQAEK